MMPLVCPGCGGRMDIEAERDLVPFSCPYCGIGLSPEKNGRAVFAKASPGHVIHTSSASGFDVAPLLQKAQEEDDPVKRYALLLKAEEKAPLDLRVQKALLLHGRLHDRNKRKADFHVIKCYLLHAYEEPDAYPEIKREQMVRELFAEERLGKAMELADDPASFLLEYLTDLSRAYISVFLMGSSRYMKPLFGFNLGGKPSRLLASPCALMLARMTVEPLLKKEQQEALARAFYRACKLEFQGETTYLDEALGPLRQRFHAI